MKKLKNCIHCGREFKPACNAQKYCKACAMKMYWSAKKKKEECGKAISSLNAEARAAGMSYGQYVAKMQIEKRREKKQ